jgi:Zn-dependent peptidase ImmA (M78 family)/plasmid maintenance system antidote protein VapI
MQNPERVELVRLRLGLTKIGFAKTLGVDRKTIQRFYDGDELSEAMMARLCQISGYPEDFFEKPSVEYPNPDGVSFRSLRSLIASARDSALAAAALAFEIDDWITARFDLPQHTLPQVNNRSPADAAAAVRSYWGIGTRPIGNMLNLLEARGVRVFSLVEETRHLDAYSFWRNDKPYIFLNTLKTPEHSRFDAAHELGHLVMHRHTGSAHKSAEDEAHTFASAFLMPRADLLAHMPTVRSLSDLIEAKKRWRVSVAALNYALHKIGVISSWHYRGNYIELNKGGRHVEPNGIQPETSQVWTKVLTALWREGTTLGHLARELSIPERELSNLLFGIVAPPPSGQALPSMGLRIIK